VVIIYVLANENNGACRWECLTHIDSSYYSSQRAALPVTSADSPPPCLVETCGAIWQ